MAVAYNPRIVTNGLALYLDAANPQSYPGSGTTWTDLSRNGNNGTLTNGPTFNSNNRGSIVFDGVNDYVNLPTSAGNFTTQDFSFLVWINITSFTTTISSSGPVLFWKGNTNLNGYYSQIIKTSPSLSYCVFVTNQSSVFQITYSTTSIGLATWYCLCVTRTGSSVRIYINGKDATATAGTHIDPAAATGNNLRISAYSSQIYGNVTYGMFGAYNRALSAAEVAQNFNATRGRFGV